MIESQPFDIVRTLTPVRRTLSAMRVLHCALRGLGAGALLGVLALAISHLPVFPRSGDLRISIGLACLALGALAGILYGLWDRADLLQAARAADRHFALNDRLTTALELRLTDSPVSSLQRADVVAHLSGLRLAESGRAHIDRNEGAVVAALLLAFGLLSLIGGPAEPRRPAAQSRPESQRIRQVVTLQMPSLIRRFERGLTPQERRDPAVRKLELELTRLQRQLLRAPSRAAALRAISTAQQRLQHVAGGLHPINSRAVAQLNRSLRPYASPANRENAASGNRKALTAASRTLQQLAGALSHMSSAQRAALASALARTASASSDRTLRDALQRAASSLAYNDPRSAAQSLRAAASALARSPTEAAARSAAGGASTAMDSLKNDISGLSSSSGSPSGGKTTGSGSGARGTGASQGSGDNQPGRGMGRGFGTRPGSNRAGASGAGKGTGSGSGRQPGNGSGSGQGTHSGLGAGSGSGSGHGSAGAHGTGGGPGIPRVSTGQHGQGQYATVYVPYHQGNGPSIIQTGPNGAPRQARLVPYQQVIGQFSSSARTALDRSALPPAQQSYVRRYFTAISH